MLKTQICVTRPQCVKERYGDLSYQSDVSSGLMGCDVE